MTALIMQKQFLMNLHPNPCSYIDTIYRYIIFYHARYYTANCQFSVFNSIECVANCSSSHDENKNGKTNVTPNKSNTVPVKQHKLMKKKPDYIPKEKLVKMKNGKKVNSVKLASYYFKLVLTFHKM